MTQQQSSHLPVEETFNEYVQAFGGKLVQDVIPAEIRTAGAGHANADYYFPDEQEPIIAEVKCLENNLFSTPEFRAKMLSLHQGWVRKGIVPPVPGPVTRIATAQLPDECRWAVFQLVKNPIERVIGKASDQIKATRRYLNLPNTKGLLLLVNDGHQGLDPQQLVETVGWILTNQEKAGINSVIIMTVNLRATMPGINRDILLWTDAFRPNMELVSREFLDRFRDGWMQFFQEKQKDTVPIYRQHDHEVLGSIRNIRTIST